MKLYSRKNFLLLPEGIVYYQDERYAFEDLQIKGKSSENDWCFQRFSWINAGSSVEAFEILGQMEEGNISCDMNDLAERDGCFNEDAVFLVLEKNDLLKLIGYLTKSLKEAY